MQHLMAVPSLGTLMGVQGNRDLVDSINRELGSTSYFGSEQDMFRDNYQSFMTNVVEPIRFASRLVATTANRLFSDQKIYPISSLNELRCIPPEMMVAVATFDPVYTLLGQGRVDGYGFDPVNLVEEKKMYDRLLETNGLIELDLSLRDKDGFWTETTIEESDDPNYSFDDLDAFRFTRAYVQFVLDTTDRDPTLPDEIIA